MLGIMVSKKTSNFLNKVGTLSKALCNLTFYCVIVSKRFCNIYRIKKHQFISNLIQEFQVKQKEQQFFLVSCRLMNDPQFEIKMSINVNPVWLPLKELVNQCPGYNKDPNFHQLTIVEKIIQNLKGLGQPISLKLHFFPAYLRTIYFPTNPAVGEEQQTLINCPYVKNSYMMSYLDLEYHKIQS